ncbi:MAG: Surface presentation of antigens protein SpaR [Chlamydiia bacterium]|nr:Surface presentation of antigens protein SpaR [Chlamydiia bacterium]
MDSEFLNLLLNLPGYTPINVLTSFLLIFLRLAPIAALAPFLGAKIAPASARAALVFALSLVLLPTALTYSKGPIAYNGYFVFLALKEILIGFVIGFIVSLPFLIVQTSGIIIDFMRGSSMMMQQDPSTQTQTSPIGVLMNYVLIVLFFQLDGAYYFFNGVSESFQYFPLDGAINPANFRLSHPFWTYALDIPHRVFALGIQLAAPSILAILMAEFFLGIANRLAPQVQIAFLGMSLKSLLGLTLLFVAWFFVLQQMSGVSLDWVESLKSHLQTLSR